MLVPSYLYGLYRDVKAACNRKVTQLKRGATWDQLTGDLVDTRELPGFLVVDGPYSLVGGQPHFHFFAITRAIDSAISARLPEDTYVTLFEPAIHTIWGFLAMLTSNSRVFLHQPGHQQRMLHLAVRWWDELDAEGARYTTGSNQGKRLWDLPTKLKFCLARQGLPEEMCQEPLPPGGLAELVAQTWAGLGPTAHELH